MDLDFRDRFLALWARHFPGAELPLAFGYADGPGRAEVVPRPKGWRCFVGQLARARAGHPLAFGEGSFGCSGGARYTGFSDRLRPHFAEFLSCGLPGVVEGERYKKTPALVREVTAAAPPHRPRAGFLRVARWDALDPEDAPEVAAFFAPPDVLSGLFTWANFEEADPFGVIAPFGAACATLLQYPCAERDAARQRAVLGTFDVSARPFVPAGVLSFAVPWPKLERMVADADECFLETDAWAKVRARIERAAGRRAQDGE